MAEARSRAEAIELPGRASLAPRVGQMSRVGWVVGDYKRLLRDWTGSAVGKDGRNRHQEGKCRDCQRRKDSSGPVSTHARAPFRPGARGARKHLPWYGRSRNVQVLINIDTCTPSRVTAAPSHPSRMAAVNWGLHERV